MQDALDELKAQHAGWDNARGLAAGDVRELINSGALAHYVARLREEWAEEALAATEYPKVCSHDEEPDYCDCCKHEWEKSIRKLRESIRRKP